METIKGENWVQRIVGLDETEFRKHVKEYVKEKESSYSTPEMIIVNKQTNEEYN